MVYTPDSKSGASREWCCGFDPRLSYMNKNIVFKSLMHEPMIIEGSGNIEKLSEVIGDNNVERLINLGVIKENDGSFEVTDLGKKFVEIFNKN